MKYRMRLSEGIALIIAAMCLGLVQLFGASAFSGYSDATLRRLAEASSLSYLSIDKMTSSPYYDTCQLEPIAQVIDVESESGATIFRASDDGHSLVVACRGSANVKNFATNLQFNLVPATRLSQEFVPEDAMVHDGFQTASAGLWKELSRPLERLVSSTSDIVFTGHSLGAATAQLCATHYNAASRGPPPAIVTFGGPRLCNTALARHLRDEALAGCVIVHLVHAADPVLANNQKLWDTLGFESVGIDLDCEPHRPVAYGIEGTAPKKAPLGTFAWNIVDHCKYMGVFVGPRVFF